MSDPKDQNLGDGERDYAVRALTEDGAFRVIGIVTTDTVRRAVAAQQARGEAALRLADLMTGAVLIRETTLPARRVQVSLQDEDGRNVVADAHPDGMNRGFLSPEGPPAGGRLTVNYTLRNAALHQGVVAVPPETSVSSALMTYLQESEQIVSVIDVATVADGDEVAWAGGFVVQLLPEAEREALEEMTRRLSARPPLVESSAPDTSAHDLVEGILAGLGYGVVAESPLRFGCTCSEGRVIAALRSLSEDAVEEMISDGEPIEARCDACGAVYVVEPSALMDA